MENIRVEIVDMQSNVLPLIEEFTEVKSPVLVYNGSDDRFQNIMSSQLNFNMLVSDAQDGKFIHLFTGDETRYRVLVSDISDALNPVLIWQGHLLPEQFSEPYQSSAFFVDFVATDGIGRLKSKYLSDTFYLEKKSIASLLSECLLLTGNDFDLYVAPAIKNALDTDLRISDLAINTFMYVNNDKKTNAYDILKGILEFLCCKLFQYAGAWYIVGLNRFKDTTILFEKYSNGNFVSEISMTRNTGNAIFEASPTVSFFPKLKSVSVDYDKKATDNLLPDNVVDQKDIFEALEINIVDVKYFNIVGNSTSLQVGLSPFSSNQSYIYNKLDGEIIDLNAYKEWVAFQDKSPDWFYFTIYQGDSDFVNNYIELQEKYYVKGSNLGGIKFDFSLDLLVNFQGNQSVNSITTADFNNNFIFEILLNGVVILSNLSSSDYNFEVSSDYFTNKIGTVKITGLLIKEDGVLSLRFRNKNQVQSFLVERIVYRNLSLKYYGKNEELKVIKDRDINFTTSKEITLSNCFSLVSNSLRNVLISDSYIFTPIVENIPEFTQKIDVFNWQGWAEVRGPAMAQYSVSIASFEISYQDYLFLKDNIDFVYKKVSGNLPFIHLDGNVVAVNSGVSSSYYYRTETAPPDLSGFKFLASDEIWVYKPASTNTITDKNYLIDKWSRFDASDSMQYLDVVARLYHDSVKEPLLLVDGNLFGVKFPLDTLMFNYLGNKKFLLSKLTINFTDGMTQAILIEDKQENVIDYV